MLKRTFFRWMLFCPTLLLPLFVSAQTSQTRQEYVIGNGDLLAITFWQRPELNTEARVSSAGTIEMPLIGSVQAAGLTPARLRDNIVNRISILDVRVSQAAVIVREYGSKAIYITGSVLAPGKRSFETIPNLWQILLEAGGPQPNAALNDITITRGQGAEAGKTIHVDLAEALARSDLASLPPVYPGDYINVPSASAPEPEPSPGLDDVVHVMGQVVKPGVFELSKEKEMDLFDVIVLAGGPTPAADLKDVRLYFRGRRQAEVASINMEQYMRRSTPLPLRLHPGDAIYVPPKKSRSPYFWEITRVLITSTASFIIFRIF